MGHSLSPPGRFVLATGLRSEMKLNTLEGFIPTFKQFECIVAFVITPSDFLRRGGTGFLNL